MITDSVQRLRNIMLRPGMNIWHEENLDNVMNFVLGFDAAHNYSVLKGYREWLLANYSQCDGPFYWPTFIIQILTEDKNGKEAVDAFFDILTRFLDETYEQTSSSGAA